MNYQNSDYAALVLRLSLGVMFVAHGLLKLLVFGLAGTAGFFESIGFPGWTAYLVAPAEVLIGIALILGVYSRWVALASLPILGGALWVHAGNGWLFSNANGGWEFPLFLIASALVVALLGDGRIAAVRSRA
ncbi:MAG: DoxX family protein [Xanthomonadales bacterium]|nr:DoxX family protein [Xanthomonadales bacterium]